MQPGVSADDDLLTFEDLAIAATPDPYPALDQLRQYGAVVPRMPMFEGEVPGTFSLLSFDAVAQVLRDERTYSSQIYELSLGPTMGHTIISMGGDEHDAHRGLVSPAFRQRALARWQDELIRPVVDALIDQFAGEGHADLVRALTFLFPVLVIARILGLPPEDHAQFQRWSLELLAARGQRGIDASNALREYFSAILADRRAEPRDDLISDLVSSEIDGERLDDEAVVSFLRLLLPAGVETTFRSTSNLLLLLLTHPDQLEALVADRSLLPAAIEEGLRFEAPLVMIARTALADGVVAGVDVPKDSTLLVWLGAANRDPQRWDRANEFDIARPTLPNASFGGGPHLCLGMHLARLESRVAIDAVLDRLPALRLETPDDAPLIRGSLFRSPPALPVRFDARAA